MRYTKRGGNFSGQRIRKKLREGVMDRGSVVKRLQRKRFSDRLLEYVLLTAATIIMVVGIYMFKFPNHFSFGGVTGIAVVLSAVTPLSAGTINFGLNMALLALGFLFLGKESGVKTFYVSMLMSFGLSFMEKVFPMSRPLTDEPMLELVFAIALPAFSSAVLFNIGASSGGTDIVAMIMKKYSRMDNIGTTLFLVDLVITIAACFVFDVKTGLFSFLGLLAKSLMIDGVIENINLCKYFTIICDHPRPICEYIHMQLGRSATVYEGEGTYERKKKYIILTVLKRGQAVELRNFIKVHEPDAFLMITNSSEIIGKGFRGLN